MDSTVDLVWFDDYAENGDDFEVVEYDLTAVPNDFNVLTIITFIDSGSVIIPGFQRNYVWDIGRASKLIESLILGLPVPQIFLYEESRNRFLVIDGQQRLMSIYYFVKQRFPLKEKRVELRAIFDRNGQIPESILHDDTYFTKFNLSLPARLPDHPNPFDGFNYSTLDDLKTQLDLRPIRNVIVKQNAPPGDDSSIYEIFNRLNSGGMNLTPQEIRASLYHSEFYDTLRTINTLAAWRRFVPSPDPDLHMKDIEILLRGFAMLILNKHYSPSMTRFLNQFSTRSRGNTKEQNEFLTALFASFLEACRELPNEAFISNRTGRFNIALFEAVFTATCEKAFARRQLLEGTVSIEGVTALETDPKFVDASLQGTTKTANVGARLSRARQHIRAL